MKRTSRIGAAVVLLAVSLLAHAQQECAEKQNEARIAERATHGWLVLASDRKRAADTKADYEACIAAVNKRRDDQTANLQKEEAERRQYKQDHAPSVMVGFNGKPLPRDPSLDRAGLYTPDAFFKAAEGHGWIEFDDTPQARLWMAYNLVGNQPHVAWVALKQAEKGINGGFTGLTAIGGQVLCGVNGSAPNYAHIVYAFQYAANGAPISSEGPVGTFALTPGTEFADAVKQACEHLASDRN